MYVFGCIIGHITCTEIWIKICNPEYISSFSYNSIPVQGLNVKKQTTFIVNLSINIFVVNKLCINFHNVNIRSIYETDLA